MDLKQSFLQTPFSQSTQMAVLRKIGLLKNSSGILRGQINDVVVVGNSAVKVSGDYPDPILKKIVEFNVVLEQINVTAFLKDRTLLIKKPVGARQFIWNVDACTTLTEEFGIAAHVSDFIPKRLSPDATVVELTYVPYHPFFYGTIKIALSEGTPASNVYRESELAAIETPLILTPDRSFKLLFDVMNTGDYLSRTLIEVLQELSKQKLTYVNGRSKNNLYAATVTRKSHDELEICFNHEYQLGDAVMVTIIN